MRSRTLVRGERGMALVTVLLITLAVGTAIVGGVLLGGNAYVLNRFHDRYSVLEAAADAGLEQGRSMVNGNKALYPATGYGTLENGVAVKNASGAVIPGVTRWLYVGPVGIKTGQYGVFGSVVAVVKDQMGNTVVRRLEMQQESFAKYALFSNSEQGKAQGGGEIWGPFHTNDSLILSAPGGQVFHGPVTVGKHIVNVAYGTFDQGYTQYAPVISLPTTTDLNALKAQAQAGGTYFLGNTVGTPYKATTRIEFIAQDLNDPDAQATGSNEGFFRVYQSLADANWVMASTPTDSAANGLRNSPNCGHSAANGTSDGATHTTTHPFFPASLHGSTAQRDAALTSSTRRCYLGGAEELTPTGLFNATYGGNWVKFTDFPDALVSGAVGATPAKYLFPATRDFNANFKGVIFVEGNVAVSGRVRGRVTLVATGNIMLVDDITYVTNPAVGTCADMLGLFAGGSIWVAGNTINSPQQPWPGYGYITYDDTKDEFFHSVILTLNTFGSETPTWTGPQSTTEEPCETFPQGRGCLYITGGVVNNLRGTVGGGSGGGYLKRYSWDACGLSDPPPYFPTTGHFFRGRYFDVDPTGFDITTYFNLLQQ